MNSNKSKITIFHVFMAVILLIGVFFRFYHLDRKIYWNDEVYTSLRISGYTKSEIFHLISNREVDITDLRKYQDVHPDRNSWDTIKSLAVDDAHPPLYFLIIRLWVQWFGTSVQAIRSLSVWMSLLIFPCVYWLCVELFKSTSVGWIALALTAASPFHILYAQEARQYSLWTVFILLSSIFLLRAIRLHTKLNWGIYAATIALGIYCHLLSFFVVMSHGFYVFSLGNFQKNKIRPAFVYSALLGILLFLPWSLYTINFMRSAIFSHRTMPFFVLLQRWFFNLNSIFFDFQIVYEDRLFDVLSGEDTKMNFLDPSIYMGFLILMLIFYALYFLYKNCEKRSWLFIYSLIGLPSGIFVIADLLFGGQRSTIGRFLIQGYLGIQLSVAYLFAMQLTSSAHNWLKTSWQLSLGLLFFVGILSCAMSSQAETWWTKYSSYYVPQVARMVNQAPAPLIVSDQPIRLLTLSYLLPSHARCILTPGAPLPHLPAHAGAIFLFHPSESLRRRFEQEPAYTVQAVHAPGYLWRIESRF